MKRLLAPLFLIFSLIAGCIIATGQATNTLIQQPFTFTAAGQWSPILLLNGGQGNCSVVVDNIGGGVTIVPKATSDINPTLSSQWSTATNINSGSIATFGTFTGVVSSATNGGLSGFAVTVTSLTSGTVTGKISCSNASGSITATLSGGSVTAIVSPIPLPVTVGNFPATGPTNAAGDPIVQVSSAPSPQPFQTAASTAATVTNCDPTVSLQCAKVTTGNALYSATVLDSTGLPVIPQTCDQSKVGTTIVTATTTAVLAVSGSNKYFICGWQILPQGTNTTATVLLEDGTGATCGVSTFVFSPTYTPPAAATTNSNMSFFSLYAVRSGPAAGAVCAVTTGGAVSVQVTVVYATHT